MSPRYAPTTTATRATRLEGTSDRSERRAGGIADSSEGIRPERFAFCGERDRWFGTRGGNEKASTSV
eukprot:3243053-Prymnesium_polylepis.1